MRYRNLTTLEYVEVDDPRYHPCGVAIHAQPACPNADDDRYHGHVLHYEMSSNGRAEALCSNCRQPLYDTDSAAFGFYTIAAVLIEEDPI